MQAELIIEPQDCTHACRGQHQIIARGFVGVFTVAPTCRDELQVVIVGDLEEHGGLTRLIPDDCGEFTQQQFV